MKRKVFLGTLLWSLLISAAHVQLNVGWANLRESLSRLGWSGTKPRRELVVGFLPVT